MAKKVEAPKKLADEFAQTVRVKKATIELITTLMETLDQEMKSATTDYRRIGKETEQAKDWKTGELLWEDDEKTVPKYEDKWGRVPLTEEEMTPDNYAKIDAINVVSEALANLV